VNVESPPDFSTTDSISRTRCGTVVMDLLQEPMLVDEKTERMGAGYVVEVDPIPTKTLSIRVGGPLDTTRAEAGSLLQLKRDVGRSCD
jgi:hypothetical protein